MSTFPSMKAGELERLLTRAPLSYEVVRQRGSHRIMRATGRPQILFSAHNSATLPPRLVRKILVDDVGLTEAQALDLIHPGTSERAAEMSVAHVVYHRESDGWWAESPSVAGFSAAAPSLTELRELVREGMPFYLDDSDVDLREETDEGGPVVVVRPEGPPIGWNATSVFVTGTHGAPAQQNSGVEYTLHGHRSGQPLENA